MREHLSSLPASILLQYRLYDMIPMIIIFFWAVLQFQFSVCLFADVVNYEMLVNQTSQPGLRASSDDVMMMDSRLTPPLLSGGSPPIFLLFVYNV